MKSKAVSVITLALLLASIFGLGFEVRSVSAPDLSIEATSLWWNWSPIVYLDHVWPIYVNVTNQGTADAGSFNVSFSAYWEEEEVPEVAQKKTIASLGQGVTDFMQFNFSAIKYGNYTIVVMADCDNDVAELDETNNVKTEWVIATRLGDIDGDGVVDWQDFGKFATAYGSKGPPQKSPADPNYNGAADFDRDGDVDWVDFGVFAARIGPPV